MKPYYEDELVTLYNADALKHDEWLQADVLVVDPPYGDSYESNSRRVNLPRSIVNDGDTHVRDSILERWTGPALVFGKRKIPEPPDVRMYLVWDKGGALGMGDLRIPWKPGHEEIYVLGDGPWTGPRTNDVLCYPPVQSMAKNGRLHPHEKPVSLMVELVGKTLGTVADPTCGVGSTLVAAKRIGRRAIGFEIDRDYCDLTVKRLRAEITLDVVPESFTAEFALSLLDGTPKDMS